jgi:hypothetical protein
VLRSARREDLLAAIAPGGSWDAFAFVDACESATNSCEANTMELLKQIQAVEIRTLESWIMERVVPGPDSAR